MLFTTLPIAKAPHYIGLPISIFTDMGLEKVTGAINYA